MEAFIVFKEIVWNI